VITVWALLLADEPVMVTAPQPGPAVNTAEATPPASVTDVAGLTAPFEAAETAQETESPAIGLPFASTSVNVSSHVFPGGGAVQASACRVAVAPGGG